MEINRIVVNEELLPMKIGIRVSPPALTLVYKVCKDCRVKIMPVRFMNNNEDVTLTMRVMKNRHDILKNIPDFKVEKMLRILQETLKGSSIQVVQDDISKMYIINPNEDMNKLSDDNLSRMKSIMNESFFKHQVTKEDEKFEYDVQIDYDPIGKTDAGWDSNSSEEFF